MILVVNGWFNNSMMKLGLDALPCNDKVVQDTVLTLKAHKSDELEMASSSRGTTQLCLVNSAPEKIKHLESIKRSMYHQKQLASHPRSKQVVLSLVRPTEEATVIHRDIHVAVILHAQVCQMHQLT